MKDTCRDFWKMVHDRKCGVIVMTSDLKEGGQVIVDDVMGGAFIVSTVSK